MEFVLTLAAGLSAYWIRRDALTASLIVAWFVSLVASLCFRDQWLPGAYAVIDMAVAVAALSLWTRYESQRARFVGALSIVMICAHFGYSATGGIGDWRTYAAILNAGFILQCFTAGGGWNGLANIYDRVRLRRRRLHNAGHRGR